MPLPLPATTVLDTFNRANAATLGPNWGVSQSWRDVGLAILSNAAVTTHNAGINPNCAGSYWNQASYGVNAEFWGEIRGSSWIADDWVEIDLYTVLNPAWGTEDGFWVGAWWDGALYHAEIGRYNAGVAATLLGDSALSTPVTGIGFRRLGTTLTLWVRRAGTWTAEVTVTEPAHPLPLWPQLGLCTPVGSAIGWETFGAGTLPTVAPGWFARSLATSAATSGTTLTISTPAGTVDADILVCALGHKGTGWAVLPAGWQLVDRVLQGATRTELHWKRAASEGASVAITGVAIAAGCIRAYGGGRRVGSVVSIAGSATSPGGDNAVVSTLDVGLERALLVAAVAQGGNQSIDGMYAAYTTLLLPSVNLQGVRDYNIVQPASRGGNPRTTGISCALCDVQKRRVGDAGNLRGTTNGASYPDTTKFTYENGLIVAALIPETDATTSGTRYYLTQKRPDTRIEGQLKGGWQCTWSAPNGNDAQQSPKMLSMTKSDGGRTLFVEGVTNVPNSASHLYTGMSPRLEAQSISGTIDVTGYVNARFQDRSLGSMPVSTFWKLHVYISVGQSMTVRQTLLNRYVDSANHDSQYYWTGRSLAAPVALTPGTCQAGDSIVVELGFAVGAFPTPVPLRPPDDWAALSTVIGTQGSSGSTGPFGPACVDCAPGDIYGASQPDRCTVLAFSQVIVEQPPVVNPATNVTSDTAAIIPPTLPFKVGPISTADLARPHAELWWKWTAPYTGRFVISAAGTTYPIALYLYTDPSSIGTLRSVSSEDYLSVGDARCFTGGVYECVAGTTYYIKQWQHAFGAPSAGGSLTLSLTRYEPPANNDVILASSGVGFLRYREGVLVDIGYDTGYTWTGIAIDTSGRTLISLQDDLPHTGPRIYTAIFPTGPVEVLDLITYEEITYTYRPFPTVSSSNWADGKLFNPFQLVLAGDNLYTGWAGNGFTRVATTQSPGELTGSFQLDPATTQSHTLTIWPAAQMDDQPGNPFGLAPRYDLAQAGPGSGAGSIAVGADGDVYYTNGGTYLTTGAQIVHRYRPGTGQLPDFATLPVADVDQPDVKGLVQLQDGTWLVTNGNTVVRLSAVGAVVQTYLTTPKAIALVDVRPTSSHAAFWAVDQQTQALYKFDVASGAQLLHVDTYSGQGNCMQIAVYVTTPPPEPPTTICVNGTFVVDTLSGTRRRRGRS